MGVNATIRADQLRMKKFTTIKNPERWRKGVLQGEQGMVVEKQRVSLFFAF